MNTLGTGTHTCQTNFKRLCSRTSTRDHCPIDIKVHVATVHSNFMWEGIVSCKEVLIHFRQLCGLSWLRFLSTLWKIFSQGCGWVF